MCIRDSFTVDENAADEERVEEIAHMLSGATLTEAALNNAKALLGIDVYKRQVFIRAGIFANL